MAPSQYWGNPLTTPCQVSGIDQSPGARSEPPKGSWELSQKADPRGDGRTEACSGGMGMIQRGGRGKEKEKA